MAGARSTLSPKPVVIEAGSYSRLIDFSILNQVCETPRKFADAMQLCYPVVILSWQTLHPIPYTLHPTPYTLHPTPYTLHPTPYTLHPTPYTLHPTPYTLHPTPYTCMQLCYPVVILSWRSSTLTPWLSDARVYEP